MKRKSLAKRTVAAVMIMILLCAGTAALAESFEERVFTFVNLVNGAMMDNYGEDVMCPYDSYGVIDDYDYWFNTVDAETSEHAATLQIMGDDEWLTGGQVLCKGINGYNTGMATAISFFAIQGLEEEELEIAQWLDERYSDIISVVVNGTELSDGYVTENDHADFIVQSMGEGVLNLIFNYYPEGRSAFFEGGVTMG